MAFHDFASAAQTIDKQSGPERQFSASKLIFSLSSLYGKLLQIGKKSSTKKRLFKYSLLIRFQPTLKALGAKAPSSDCLDSLHWRFATRSGLRILPIWLPESWIRLRLSEWDLWILTGFYVKTGATPGYFLLVPIKFGTCEGGSRPPGHLQGSLRCHWKALGIRIIT